MYPLQSSRRGRLYLIVSPLTWHGIAQTTLGTHTLSPVRDALHSLYQYSNSILMSLFREYLNDDDLQIPASEFQIHLVSFYFVFVIFVFYLSCLKVIIKNISL